MSFENLRISVDAGVARIVLNRPEKLNAVTRALLLELHSALADIMADDSVRVIVLTGEGRAFCAGQDLSERDPRQLEAPLDLAAIQRELYHPILLAMAGSDKPVIALVNGVAAGAGAGLALGCDIVIAAQSARFVFSFVKVGLSVDAGLGRQLVQGLGAARACALLMTGGALTAQEAAEAGLIWRAVDDDELYAAGDDLATELARAPKAAIAGIKRAIAAAHQPLEDYLDTEATLQGRAGAAPDYAEGVLAFLERRKPGFS